jgi:hypothetical protein
LAHVSREAHDWQKLVDADLQDFEFFGDIESFVSRACRFHRRRIARQLSVNQLSVKNCYRKEMAA